MLLSALAVVNLNHISKTRLVNRTGQSLKTGVVVRILEDNIQEDGMRVGQQTVVVRMTSGEKKGRSLSQPSSAGLFIWSGVYSRECVWWSFKA